MSGLIPDRFNHCGVIKCILGPGIATSFVNKGGKSNEIIVWNESFVQVIIKNFWPINSVGKVVAYQDYNG